MEINQELETLSLVAKYTNYMVIIINHKSEITWVNEAFIRKMKFTLDEVLSKRPGDFLNGPLSGLKEGTSIRTAIKNRVSFKEEIVHYTKDAEPIWILADGQPIFDTKGELTKYIIVETDITDQKQQQEILKRTESDLNAFFNSSGSKLILFDKSLKITAFNKRAESFIKNHYNFSLQNGITILNIFKCFEIEKFGTFALDTLNGFGIENFEIELKKIGIWWNVRFLSIYDSFGSIIGGSFTAIDITERKKADIILKQSEERFNLVSKATFDAIWDWDIENNFLFRGEGYFTLFGYQYGMLKNDPSNWDNLIHKDDVQKILTDFQSILESHETNWNEEYRFLKSDGTFAYVRDKAIIIRDKMGKPLRMVGAMQDITSQKLREQQLVLLESVITNTKDAVLITDAVTKESDGFNIIYVNPAFTEMTGYTFQEVNGKNPRFLQGAETNSEEIERLRNSIKQIKSCEVEIINYKKNGEPFWVNLSISPVINEKSECTHWISIQKEITEKRREMLVREEMIKELSKNNTELLKFSYITTHNLRSPITNMIGLFNLIDKSLIVDKRLNEIIDGLKTSTYNLNEAVNDLINILFIKENMYQNIEKIDLYMKLKKVMDILNENIQVSGTKILIDFNEANYVYFNRIYLQNIFLQLISNAIRFKKPEEDLIIKCYTKLESGKTQLFISDNGQGMDWEKVKNKIFGLYQKFHKNSISKGVGLFLVQSQIIALGGSIEVQTALEKGTTFIITFKTQE